MSHFSVLVVGGNVEEQLAPYHEFESTGNDDQYVKEVDQTEEARKEFATDTTTRYKDPEGNLHNPFTPEGNWDSKFWRDLTPEENALYGKGYHQDYDETPEHGGLCLYTTNWHDGSDRSYTKAFAWPSEGWSEVEVLKSTVETFAEFCEDYYGHKIVPFGEQPNFGYTLDAEGRKTDSNHKYGYTIVDENGDVVKTIDRTNPDRKWDWYSIGGRWNGFFKLKPLAVGVLGHRGATFSNDPPPPGEDRADVLMKGDIDVEGMRDEAGEEAAERYDLVRSVAGDMSTHKTWKRCQEECQTGETDERGEPKVAWDKARDMYNAQPTVKALHANRETVWHEADDFLISREAYILIARDQALSTFAVVKDGVWYQRGSMGWWGMVSDEKDSTEWNRQFAELIDSLPDDTLLTVVDCHI